MNRMIEAIRKPGLSFLEIVVGLYLLGLAFMAGMLAEKIDLEKDEMRCTATMRRFANGMRRSSKSRKQLDIFKVLKISIRRLGQNEIAAWEEKSQ